MARRAPKIENETDILETMHPEGPICEIVKTNPNCREDKFSSYRPLPGTFRDYEISRTELKLDAGPTKIHVLKTWATYDMLDPSEIKPVKKKKKKNKYCRGGPPQWVFFGEKRREQLELQQEIFKAELKARLDKAKADNKARNKKAHDEVIARVGPVWYQELSPNQIRTVDNLEKCIQKDLKANTTLSTQENIAQLGLLLRPNHKHVKTALKECCKCPVEFLLILYQLINPGRKQYSINDRLLLSAVVHLTMERTLKELHIRIPSPPKPPNPVKVPRKKPKRKQYESPYLEPYTFKPEPKRFTGLYYDKHLQRPESPYFAYVDKLREEIRKLGDEPEEDLAEPTEKTELEKKLKEETKLAQEYYWNLFEFNGVPNLLTPSVLVPCPNFRNQKLRTSLESAKEIEPEREVDEVSLCNGLCSDFSAQKDFDCPREPHGTTSHTKEARKPCFVAPEIKPCECEPEPILCGTKKLEPCPCRLEAEKSFKDRLGHRQDDFRDPQVAPAKRTLPENGCECKKAGEDFVAGSQCPCERCEEDRKIKNLVPVISGIKELETENIAIIDSVTQGRPCNCLEIYRKRIEEYEKFQQRQKLVCTMKELEPKFLINGVVNTADGPVFCLGGISPPLHCKCSDFSEFEKKEQQRLARMPKVPGGRVKYGISGVKELPEGNVYILSQAIPIDPCPCMRMYETFENKHSYCMKMYEDYLKKMQTNINEYMEDLRPTSERRNSRNSTGNDQKENKSSFEDCEESEGSNSGEFNLEIKEPSLELPKEEAKTPWKGWEPPRRVDSGSLGKHKNMEAPICGCGRKVVEEICDCSDEPVVVACVDCQCGQVDEPESEPEPESKEPAIKRFFILDKIPCKYPFLMGVLEKALSTMAEDGFPLAKLPDCHKLPHFKLWLQMRCGKTWSQTDKLAYILISRKLWKHTKVCNQKVKMAKLKMSQEKAESLTWSDAPYCRKIVAEAVDAYYRKVRQSNVDFGCEFFPTTFSYEFPFSTFRDCYFAYTPSKEEDVIAKWVWQPFEIIDVNKRKSCFC